MESTDLIVYTTGWCGDCRAAKSALVARGIAFREVDLDREPGAAAHVESLNGGRRSVPTLVRGTTATSLSHFSLAELDAFLASVGLR